MRALKSIPALMIAVLTVAACHTGSMPSLFHYHTDEYRSPPGQEADAVGYQYSPVHNAESVAAWHAMVSDLVDRLEKNNAALKPQALYLVPHQDKSAFMNMYDHALRKTLNDRGYTLLSRPDAKASYLFFEAAPVVQGKALAR